MTKFNCRAGWLQSLVEWRELGFRVRLDRVQGLSPRIGCEPGLTIQLPWTSISSPVPWSKNTSHRKSAWDNGSQMVLHTAVMTSEGLYQTLTSRHSDFTGLGCGPGGKILKVPPSDSNVRQSLGTISLENATCSTHVCSPQDQLRHLWGPLLENFS